MPYYFTLAPYKSCPAAEDVRSTLKDSTTVHIKSVVHQHSYLKHSHVNTFDSLTMQIMHSLWRCPFTKNEVKEVWRGVSQNYSRQSTYHDSMMWTLKALHTQGGMWGSVRAALGMGYLASGAVGSTPCTLSQACT